MADGVFNVAKGRINELVRRVVANDPTNSTIVWVLLKVAEADATLQDYDDLSTLLAAAGNTECDFTNYARQSWDDTDLSNPVPDDTNNWMEADGPDMTIASAGGTTDNTIVKAIACYDSDSTGGTDSDLVPLCYYDYSLTTNGADITIKIADDGFFRAKDPA